MNFNLPPKKIPYYSATMTSSLSMVGRSIGQSNLHERWRIRLVGYWLLVSLLFVRAEMHIYILTEQISLCVYNVNRPSKKNMITVTRLMEAAGFRHVSLFSTMM